MQEFFTAVAGILFFVGYLPYIRAILRGETKPAKASWIIWGSLDTITLIGMIFAGSVNGQMVGVVAGVWIVIALALKHGEPGWTGLDKFCLSGAALGIILWQVFENPVLAILTAQAVVFVGSVPTFVSAWGDPSREDKLAWTFFWVSSVYAFLAIPSWTFADAVQPSNFLAIESIMMFILFIRPRLSTKRKQTRRAAVGVQ